jgi:hypothetical protein
MRNLGQIFRSRTGAVAALAATLLAVQSVAPAPAFGAWGGGWHGSVGGGWHGGAGGGWHGGAGGWHGGGAGWHGAGVGWHGAGWHGGWGGWGGRGYGWRGGYGWRAGWGGYGWGRGGYAPAWGGVYAPAYAPAAYFQAPVVHRLYVRHVHHVVHHTTACR